jgi:hypothetical protein
MCVAVVAAEIDSRAASRIVHASVIWGSDEVISRGEAPSRNVSSRQQRTFGPTNDGCQSEAVTARAKDVQIGLAE